MIFFSKYSCFLETVRRYALSEFRFYFCRSLAGIEDFESLDYLLMPYETPILSYIEEKGGKRKKAGPANFIPARARTFTAVCLNELTGKIDCVFLSRGDKMPSYPDLTESMISLGDIRKQPLSVGPYTLRDLDIASEDKSGPGFSQRKTKGFFFDYGLLLALLSYAAAAVSQSREDIAGIFLGAVRRIPKTWNEYQILQELDHLKSFCESIPGADSPDFSRAPEKASFARMTNYCQPPKALPEKFREMTASRKTRREALAGFFEENPQESVIAHPFAAEIARSGRIRLPYFLESLNQIKLMFMRDPENTGQNPENGNRAAPEANFAFSAPAAAASGEDGDEEISVFCMG